MLRKYQEEAVEAIWKSLQAGNHPVVQLPTGSGKSLIIAALVSKIRENGGAVWVVTHVRELLVQNKAALERYSHTEGVGIVCAGLEQNEFGENVTFGTVQSLSSRLKRNEIKPPDAIIIDEAHRTPPGKAGKLYSSLFSAFPDARRIGLTATPWRLDGGRIYNGTECDGFGVEKTRGDLWFDDLAYIKTPLEMVQMGYLCPLVGVSTSVQLDLKGVGKSAGDYVQSQVAARFADQWIDSVVTSVLTLAEGRKRVAVYCPTIEAAKKVAVAFSGAGVPSGVVTSEDADRDVTLEKWKSGELRLVANVDILTTGFDLPELDCVVVLRPTESSSLFVQILGRAARIFPGKKDALVLDYVGNLTRLGGISTMETYSVEKAPGVLVKVSAKAKSVKPKAAKKSPSQLDTSDPMAGGGKSILATVKETTYIIIPSSKHVGRRLVMISHSCETENGHTVVAHQFLCPEYTGWARAQTEEWFRKRGGRAPLTAEDTRRACYSMAPPRKVEIRKNGKYINVTKEYL